MKLPDGHLLRLGDRVSLGGEMGIVVCSIDTEEFSDRYPASEWRFLEAGVLIDFRFLGLIHSTEPEDDLVFVAHEADLLALARAWIAYYGRRDPQETYDDSANRDLENDPDWWAVETLMEFDGSAPERVVQVIDFILAETEDEWIVGNLCIGPIEDLISKATPEVLRQLDQVLARHGHSRYLYGSSLRRQIAEREKLPPPRRKPRR